MTVKTSQIKIDKLIPDDLNANKGTEYGQHLIEKSLRQFGAGRSILIDKNNRIIAGNKMVENAANIGLENVIVVETTGNQIVAVKRNDIDLSSAQGRELALADNATAKANIAWDYEIMEIEFGNIEVENWGIEIPIMYESVEQNKSESTLGKNLKEKITNHVLVTYPNDTHDKVSAVLAELKNIEGVQLDYSRK